MALPQPPPAGKQYVTCTSISPPGLSLLQNCTPAGAVNDIFVLDLVTTPNGFAIECEGDGTVIISAANDTSRQAFQWNFWRSASDTLDGAVLAYTNEHAPIWSNFINLSPAIGYALTPIDLTTYASSPSADVLAFSVASGALPPGTSLSPAGLITGVPTILGTYSFTLNATDSTGTATESPASQMVIADPNQSSVNSDGAMLYWRLGPRLARYRGFLVGSGTNQPLQTDDGVNLTTDAGEQILTD